MKIQLKKKAKLAIFYKEIKLINYPVASWPRILGKAETGPWGN